MIAQQPLHVAPAHHGQPATLPGQPAVLPPPAPVVQQQHMMVPQQQQPGMMVPVVPQQQPGMMVVPQQQPGMMMTQQPSMVMGQQPMVNHAGQPMAMRKLQKTLLTIIMTMYHQFQHLRILYRDGNACCSFIDQSPSSINKLSKMPTANHH